MLSCSFRPSAVSCCWSVEQLRPLYDDVGWSRSWLTKRLNPKCRLLVGFPSFTPLRSFYQSDRQCSSHSLVYHSLLRNCQHTENESPTHGIESKFTGSKVNSPLFERGGERLRRASRRRAIIIFAPIPPTWLLHLSVPYCAVQRCSHSHPRAECMYVCGCCSTTVTQRVRELHTNDFLRRQQVRTT